MRPPRPAGRLLLALVLPAIAAGAACRGPAGSRGATGSPGPTGPDATPPQIDSIEPHDGSAGTIFTIHGQRFAAAPVSDHVFFDGDEGTVLSSDGSTLVVQAGFAPVDAATTISVAVLVSNATSNAVTITAHPGGTFIDAFPKSPLWQTVSSIAMSGSSLWVADPTNGAFLYDTTTGAVTAIARNGENGITTVQSVHVMPSGNLLLTDSESTGNQVLRLLVPAGAAWTPFATILAGNGDRIVSIDFDPNDKVYVTLGSGQVVRLLADGTLDPSYSVFLTGPIVSAAFALDSLYALQDTGDVQRVDPAGNVTTVSALAASTLPSRSVLASDGAAMLYASGQDGTETVDPMDGTCARVGVAYGAQFVLTGNGSFLTQFGGRIGTWDATGATFTWLVAGFDGVNATGHASTGALYASGACSDSDKGGSLWVAEPAGIRRYASVCASAVASDPSGTTYAITPLAKVYRIGATGTLTPIASDADGIAFGVPALAADASAAYAPATSAGGLPSIAKIAGGTVNRDFVTLPAGLTPRSFAVDAAAVWVAATDGHVYRAPIAGGAATAFTGAILAAPVSSTSDGAGGLLVTDALAQTIYDVPATGPVVTAASNAPCYSLDRDPSGNLRCVVGTGELRTIFP